MTNEVLNSNQVKEVSNKMREDINKYTSKYWNLLINHNDKSSVRELRDEMLLEIKEILLDYKYLDAYDGFQIIAKIWEDFLITDAEKISNGDFYTIAKSREANMVSRGSGKNKRMEQDGWTGTLIPNNIIRKELYKDEAEKIEELESQLLDIESQLDELVEAAKIEDSEENEVLFSCLNTNREGEPTNSFQVSLINSELNEYEKDTEEYKMVNNVKDLLSTRTQTTREIRNKEKELKELVEERILNLTDSEVDQLMSIKWFGNLLNDMNDLIEEPLKEELDTLNQLNKRYQNTLEDLDQEYKELESTLQSMIDDLVVVR